MVNSWLFSCVVRVRVDRDGKKKVLTGLLAEGAAQALYVSIIYSPSLMVSFFGPLPTGMDPSIHSDVFARYEVALWR